MDKKEYQLIEKCKLGDTSAREWLYKEYSPVLLGVCRRYINNRMQSEDILHESFISIFEKITELKQDCSVEGWMKRIVINNSLKFLKKNREHLIDIEEINESSFDTDDTENQTGIKDQLLQSDISQEEMLLVINSLPTGFRTVFNLYVFEKYDHNEIAKELGIAASTSRSQLLRARKMTQKRLYDVVEKNKKTEKKEKVYMSSLILLMSDDLNYIDQIAFTKLNGYRIIPVSTQGFINHLGCDAGKTSMPGLKEKIALVASKKVIWISTMILGIAGVSAITLLQKNETPEQIQKVQQMVPTTVSNPILDRDTAIVLSSKTITDTSKADVMHSAAENRETESHNSVKAKEVVHRKVIMKKIITVKKEKVVTDTIKKMDTLQVK
jgi:RNA polymerase sigma-70 factor (ECF subfamily)